VRSVSERLVDARLTILSLHIPTVLDEVEANRGPSLDAIRTLTVAGLETA
jgi:hypothetical protein